LVGRHPYCDVRLGSRRVSRFHCGLYRDREEIIVRDLGSSNGTECNGIRAETLRLKTGDELSIADLRFRLEAEETPALTPVPTPRRDLEGIWRDLLRARILGRLLRARE
jgi:pSer/pThr/pTyr-binding forkhead associated (FHA) protein